MMIHAKMQMKKSLPSYRLEMYHEQDNPVIPCIPMRATEFVLSKIII